VTRDASSEGLCTGLRSSYTEHSLIRNVTEISGKYRNILITSARMKPSELCQWNTFFVIVSADGDCV